MTTTTEPRFKIGDQVIVEGRGDAICKIEKVLPATRTQPVGYEVRRPTGRVRAYTESQLEPFVTFLPPPEP
jgi:NAD-dependent DNA ligase